MTYSDVFHGILFLNRLNTTSMHRTGRRVRADAHCLHRAWGAHECAPVSARRRMTHMRITCPGLSTWCQRPSSPSLRFVMLHHIMGETKYWSCFVCQPGSTSSCQTTKPGFSAGCLWLLLFTCMYFPTWLRYGAYAYVLDWFTLMGHIYAHTVSVLK